MMLSIPALYLDRPSLGVLYLYRTGTDAYTCQCSIYPTHDTQVRYYSPILVTVSSCYVRIQSHRWIMWAMKFDDRNVLYRNPLNLRKYDDISKFRIVKGASESFRIITISSFEKKEHERDKEISDQKLRGGIHETGRNQGVMLLL